MELTQKIKDIDAQIAELRKQRNKLEEQRILEVQEKAKANVGRCFIVGSKMCKVIGIPQKEWTMTSTVFNEYQYPAIFISNDPADIVPFYEETVFSGVLGEGRAPGYECKEIKPEEFDAELVKRCVEFQHKIVDRHWVDNRMNTDCPLCGYQCNDEYYLASAVACPNCGAALKEIQLN